MPFLRVDPWREQYFKKYDCPDNVQIPTKDNDAFQFNPDYNWVYNKLMVSQKAGVKCAPHGVIPNIPYPVFGKPIYNLRSMGAGIEIYWNEKDYLEKMKPGYMWVEFLVGEHLSTDAAVINGKVIWQFHTKGYPLNEGAFDYWEFVQNDDHSFLIKTFIENNLAGYSGMVNIETIGGKCIEMHLRFADQWTDLYGNWFVKSLIDLYTKKEFSIGTVSRHGYSLALFCEPFNYKKPDQNLIDNLLKEYTNISSIQLSFFEDRTTDYHSKPPGGQRVACINGYNLKECQKVREILHQLILSCTKITNNAKQIDETK